jgi:hypothetical protein
MITTKNGRGPRPEEGRGRDLDLDRFTKMTTKNMKMTGTKGAALDGETKRGTIENLTTGGTIGGRIAEGTIKIEENTKTTISLKMTIKRQETRDRGTGGVTRDVPPMTTREKRKTGEEVDRKVVLDDRLKTSTKTKKCRRMINLHPQSLWLTNL